MQLQFASCVQACDTCAVACDYCVGASLLDPHPKELARCAAMAFDCALVCRLLSGAIARRSQFTKELAMACAQVCEACATECKQHTSDHTEKCYEVCTFCAQECRKVME
jgi:hypothetical protein